VCGKKVGKFVPKNSESRSAQKQAEKKPTERWELLRMYTIGPLQRTNDRHEFILLLTDTVTKWVYAKPLKTLEAKDITEVVINMIYTHGPPKKIVNLSGINSQILTRVSSLQNVFIVWQICFQPWGYTREQPC